MGGGVERGRERNINLLFHLFVHSLVDSCIFPDWGLSLQPWLIGTTTELPRQGSFFFFNQIILSNKSAITWKALYFPCLNYFSLSLLLRCWRWDPLLNLLSRGRVRYMLVWRVTHLEFMVRLHEFMSSRWFCCWRIASHTVKPRMRLRGHQASIYNPACVFDLHFSSIDNPSVTAKKLLAVFIACFYTCLSPRTHQPSHHLPWRGFALRGRLGCWPAEASVSGPAGPLSAPQAALQVCCSERQPFISCPQDSCSLHSSIYICRIWLWGC